jgi:DNA-binding transcriptional MerR regulator
MTPKLYKAADVCELAKLQPYVLRSWEKEFPGIGVHKAGESQRLYRQSDLDQVLRIKQLVFGEGLTLAGARRRLEAQLTAASPAIAEADDADMVLQTLGQDARARIATVRAALRSLLDALSHEPGAVPLPIVGGDRGVKATDEEYELRPPPAKTGGAKPARVKARAMATRTKAARVVSKPARRPKTTSTKRKRASA